jgi:hypothetical protein
MKNAPAAPLLSFLMGFLMLDLAPSKALLSAGQQARPSVCGQPAGGQPVLLLLTASARAASAER